MQSPYKKAIVYDLETGGLNLDHNNITEIAAVVVNLETLKVEDTFSTLIKPHFDLEFRLGESAKEARSIFKAIAEKDGETKIPMLNYKGRERTIKDLDDMIEDISNFDQFLDKRGNIYSCEQIKILESNEKYRDVVDLYFNKTYNPQAMRVTHMTREMLESGQSIEDAIESTVQFFKKHAVGNSLPILAGHNIKGFDNPFFSKFLSRGGYDLQKLICQTQMIDTLEWARLRWFEMPSYSLGVCANEVGLTLKEAHRALPDTLANADFLIKLLKDLRGEGSQKTVAYKRRKFNFNF